MTALMYAVWQSSPSLEAIDVLLKFGTNVNEKDESRKTALMYAASDSPSPEVIWLPTLAESATENLQLSVPRSRVPGWRGWRWTREGAGQCPAPSRIQEVTAILKYIIVRNRQT